jgi:hypothetical protein
LGSLGTLSETMNDFGFASKSIAFLIAATAYRQYRDGGSKDEKVYNGSINSGDAG